MNSSRKTRPELANEKEKKPKLVRDSFTIPKDEYAAIEALKIRAMTQGLAIKKSELLRAGLMALTGMSDAELKAALVAVPTLKTGRPSAQEVAEAAQAQAVAAPEATAAGMAPAGPAAAATAPQAPAPAPAPRRSRKAAAGVAAAAPTEPPAA